MPLGVGDFINTDGADNLQRSMLESPLDDILDGLKDLVPTGTEATGSFFPGKSSCPMGEKQHERCCHLMLSASPWHLFNFDATLFTIDAPHAVK